MDSKKSLKAKLKTAGKTAAKLIAAKKQKKADASAQATAAPAKNFLFSVPSLHTQDNDYEHLVIAPTKEEACRLLAEHRVTEKQPKLPDPERAQLVAYATHGYCKRNVAQIEPRAEEAGVLAINHHKLGIESPTIH